MKTALYVPGGNIHVEPIAVPTGKSVLNPRILDNAVHAVFDHEALPGSKVFIEDAAIETGVGNVWAL